MHRYDAGDLVRAAQRLLLAATLAERSPDAGVRAMARGRVLEQVAHVERALLVAP